MYFELASPTSDRSSIDLTLKMLLMTFLLLKFHAHHLRILDPLTLLRCFLLAFTAPLGTSDGFI